MFVDDVPLYELRDDTALVDWFQDVLKDSLAENTGYLGLSSTSEPCYCTGDCKTERLLSRRKGDRSFVAPAKCHATKQVAMRNQFVVSRQRVHELQASSYEELLRNTQQGKQSNSFFGPETEGPWSRIFNCLAVDATEEEDCKKGGCQCRDASTPLVHEKGLR